MSEWHRIETAPKDGTRFIGYSPSRIEPVVIVHWSLQGWWAKPGAYHIATLTHWMSLPDPPAPER